MTNIEMERTTHETPTQPFVAAFLCAVRGGRVPRPGRESGISTLKGKSIAERGEIAMNHHHLINELSKEKVVTDKKINHVGREKKRRILTEDPREDAHRGERNKSFCDRRRQADWIGSLERPPRAN